MGRRLIGQVAFSISGAYITQNVRSLMLEGEWSRAYSLLVEEMEGMTHDVAVEILAGTKKLAGDSSEDTGIYLSDDEDMDYRNEIQEMTGNIFIHAGEMYKFSRILKTKDIIDLIPKTSLSEESDMCTLLETYVSDDNENIFEISDETYLLAEKMEANSIPFWFKKSSFPQNVFEFAKKEVSKSNEEILTKETKPEVKKMTDEDFRNNVLIACKERNVEWVEATVEIDGVNYTKKYPVDIMKAYASMNYAEQVKYWEPVSPSSMKMMNDSPFHTDLWLAMGFDLDGEEYNEDNLSYKIFEKIVHRCRFDGVPVGGFKVLNDIKMKKFSGKVVFEECKNITDKDILVLPNANLKYENIAMKAGLVIVESGTALSHLAIAGKDSALPVIQMPKAMTILKKCQSLDIDFEKLILSEDCFF